MADGPIDGGMLAVRTEMLIRAGLIADAEALLARTSAAGGDPVLALQARRVALALRRDDEACRPASAGSGTALPAALRSVALMVDAFCALYAKSADAAKPLGALAREKGPEARTLLAIVGALAEDRPIVLPKDGRLGLAGYRLLRLAAKPIDETTLERASPAVLASIAADADADAGERVAAAEAAAAIGAIGGEALAAAYAGAPFEAAERQSPLASPREGPLQRALLYQAALAERSPLRKARDIRAFLDSAMADGIAPQLAAVLAEAVGTMPKSTEIAWFAGTAAEVMIAARGFAAAAAWAEFGSLEGDVQTADLRHWYVLADVGDPDFPGRRGSTLGHAGKLAARGGIAPEVLQRLVTVLDALKYDIPIPLWEAATRSAVPDTGYLPPSGVLSELQSAAIAQEQGRVLLLALEAIGPEGPARASQIGLGDTIRALGTVGLAADARALALAALLPDWPRTVGP
jgi:hypothetical protein